MLIVSYYSIKPWAYPSVGCGGGCKMTLGEDPIMPQPDKRALAQRRAGHTGRNRKDTRHGPYCRCKDEND